MHTLNSVRQALNVHIAAFLIITIALIPRFVFLGAAPFAEDEYYLGSATLLTFENGFPWRACGGDYVRGLLLQYLAAGLYFFGVPIELGLRLLAATASIVVLVFVYRIADRWLGRPTAIAALIILSLSVWQVEFARFGRMYSPFQAVFVAYVYYFCRCCIDKDHRSLWIAVGLSALSILIYEGSIFLLALNVVVMSLAPAAASIPLVLVLIVLLAVRVWLQIRSDAEPIATEVAQYVDAPLPIDLPEILFIAAPLLIAVSAIALYWLMRQWRQLALDLGHWPVRFLMLGTILAFSLNQLLLGVALFLVVLLLSERNDSAVWRKQSWAIALVISGWLSIVSVKAFVVQEFTLIESLQALINFPDVLARVIWPLADAMPITIGILGVGFTLAVWVTLRKNNSIGAANYLLVALILLALAVGSIQTRYLHPKYVYFLYPLLVVLSTYGYARALSLVLNRIAASRNWLSRAVLALPLVGAGAIAAEDISFQHLANIHKDKTLFRIEMSRSKERLYYPRRDYRGIADTINGRKGQNDIVISVMVPVVDHYLVDGIDYMMWPVYSEEYVNLNACTNTREIWTHAPMLNDAQDVLKIVDQTTQTVWLVLYTPANRDPKLVDESQLRQRFQDKIVYESIDGELMVVRIDKRGTSGSSATDAPRG